MSDQSASNPPTEDRTAQNLEQFAEALRRNGWTPPWASWLDPSLGYSPHAATLSPPAERALELGELLHCREQALYAAAVLGPDPTPFPEEDAVNADRVVAVAKRFEDYIRTGE